jgi:hypothetical protein
VHDANINQVNPGAENNTQVRTTVVHPKILSRLDKRLTTSAEDPIGNNIHAGVVPSNCLGTALVGENVPRIKAYICTAVACGRTAGGERLIAT